MNKILYIANHCTIIHNSIYLDGQRWWEEDPSLPFGSFAKNVYKANGVGYPKFFKMDALSKLAFLGAEVLFAESGILKPGEDNRVGIVLSNRAASLDTDRKHQADIDDPQQYFPSPATFVYTLPNIAIGEICIRHKLFSENAFFVFESFDAGFLAKYAASLIHNKKENSVLCGWVDIDGEHYHAFFYLVTTKGTTEHTAENILTLFNGHQSDGMSRNE